MSQAIQDFYPDAGAVCFGCGRNNEQGMHIRSLWADGEARAVYTPAPHFEAFPGVVYGGTIANLIDCHSIAAAIAAFYEHVGSPLGSEPKIAAVTASLQVSYQKPTPMNTELHLRAWIDEISERKAIVRSELRANGVTTATGEVVAVRMYWDDFGG